ncbi:proline-rich proteoglycan 2-like [Sapajus apella]|uniref:Proline-rich proteoglycan 2-like n=1 Tax=Sapajus apella TaxID=9515 RepID=A0A6J3GNY7_SAPAP|nr:proline-rich proteoglycan 2-like [Sapajus apella]
MPGSLGAQTGAGSPLPGRQVAAPAPSQLGGASPPPSGRSVKYKFKFRARPGGGGGGGREASPRSLCSPGSSLPRPLPGGAQQRPPPRPTAPLRSRLLPPARRLFPIPASPLGATEGSRGSGRGVLGAERRDTSPWEPPQPRSPSGKLCWPDGCPRGGKRSSNMATRIQILPLSPLP